MKKGIFKNRIRTNILFLLPALLLYIAFFVMPFFQGIPYSFTNWNGVLQDYDFVFFKNYINLFQNKEFWISVKNTFTYALLFVVFSNLLGLTLALLLHKNSRLNNFSRTLIFMPYVISLLTAAFVWKYIFNNVYIPLFNRPSPLAVSSLALFGIVFISIWRNSGYCMLVYIAALQGVPNEYYEAAKVEGANWFSQFKSITLPMIVPAITANITLLLAWGLKVFDSVMATTNGGPGKSTLTMAMYVYNNIFGYMKAGYGQAAAAIMTIILLIISMLVSKLLRSKEVEA